MPFESDAGPFILTLVRTGARQKVETFEIETVGLGLNGALQFVSQGQAHTIPSGGWKTFEVSRPAFQFRQIPSNVVQGRGRRPVGR